MEEEAVLRFVQLKKKTNYASSQNASKPKDHTHTNAYMEFGQTHTATICGLQHQNKKPVTLSPFSL